MSTSDLNDLFQKTIPAMPVDRDKKFIAVKNADISGNDLDICFQLPADLTEIPFDLLFDHESLDLIAL